MFRMVEFEDMVRVDPRFFSDDPQESIKKSLARKYENTIREDLGVVLRITEAEAEGEGKVVIGDPGVYYKTRFKALVYTPVLHEVIIGEVSDITEFGVFVTFGPIDGLCHISQVIDDYVTFDEKSKMLIAKETKRKLRVKDKVRARIIAVSLNKREVNKINLTMRQPGLGSLEWIREEKEKKKKEQEKKAKKG